MLLLRDEAIERFQRRRLNLEGLSKRAAQEDVVPELCGKTIGRSYSWAISGKGSAMCSSLRNRHFHVDGSGIDTVVSQQVCHLFDRSSLLNQLRWVQFLSATA